MLHHARRELSELLTVVTTALMLACRGGIRWHNSDGSGGAQQEQAEPHYNKPWHFLNSGALEAMKDKVNA